MSRFAALILLALALCVPAFAACTTPTGNAGQLIYSTTNKNLQLCNGTDWQPLGSTNIGGGSGPCTSPAGPEGKIIYNTSANILQYCNGDVWMNMGADNSGVSTDCTSPAGPRGKTLYNSSTGTLQYCNGTAWVNASGWEAADTTPNSFSFTNLSSQATSSQVNSNIIQVTGINILVSASTSGASSEIRSCADSSCSTVLTTWAGSLNFSSNQYLQARQTTSGSSSTSTSATIVVGTGNTIWSATTSGVTPGSQNYTTPGTYTYTVPNYNTLTVVTTKGGTGGTGGTGYNATTYYCGDGMNCCTQGTAVGGSAGSPGGNSTFASSTPVVNTTKVFNVGDAGAPVPGSTITVTVGAGGAGGAGGVGDGSAVDYPQGNSCAAYASTGTTGATGSAGSVNTSWN